MGVLDMNEDFVSFSLAKKLKEKGYPQKPDNMSCMPYYEYDEVANYTALCNEIVWHMSTEPRDTIFAAPAIHKVLKWLREEKGVHIEIRLFCVGYGFDIIRITDRKKLAWSGTDERDKYEQAVLAGIEYVLDNLI